jgi:hypothetical protein
LFGKLAIVIVVLGLYACALLQLRHERLHAASELVRIQLRVRSQDEELWKLRTEIGRLVTPEQVRVMAANIGPLRPLVPARPGSPTAEMRQASTHPASPPPASAKPGPGPESADSVARREKRKPQ